MYYIWCILRLSENRKKHGYALHFAFTSAKQNQKAAFCKRFSAKAAFLCAESGLSIGATRHLVPAARSAAARIVQGVA